MTSTFKPLASAENPFSAFKSNLSRFLNRLFFFSSIITIQFEKCYCEAEKKHYDLLQEKLHKKVVQKKIQNRSLPTVFLF